MFHNRNRARESVPTTSPSQFIQLAVLGLSFVGGVKGGEILRGKGQMSQDPARRVEKAPITRKYSTNILQFPDFTWALFSVGKRNRPFQVGEANSAKEAGSSATLSLLYAL